MTTPEISYCAMMKTGNFLPQFKFFEDFKYYYARNISIECPMKPRKLYMNVAEFMGDENQYKNPVDLNINSNGVGMHLPNGKKWNQKRSKRCFFQWILEMNIRLHEDNF
jgi:hypothetical protein